MKKICCAALFLIFIFVFSLSIHGAITHAERVALIALYNATNGDSWTNKGGWKQIPVELDGFGLIGSEKNWYGITANAGNTTIVQITLNANNLVGSIPTDLASLGNLQVLNFDNNQLSGSIPTQLGSLSNLLSLNLGRNQLTGAIPAQLGSLGNLQDLYFYSNQLSGAIPAQLGSLGQLLNLGLSYNQLSGTIPAELGNLSNLQSLNLSTNQLTGTIPAQLGNLSNLDALFLDSNQLSGAIPAELGNLSNLRRFYLNFNQLSGAIPSQLGSLANVQEFMFNQNQLSGTIPAELGNMTYVQYIYLYSNQLSGPIPAQLGNLSHLSYLYLQNNQLTGTIPAELGSLGNLQRLDLNHNQLSGPLPSQLGNLTNLTLLYLHANKIVGAIPTSFTSLTKLDASYTNIGYNGLYSIDAGLTAFLNSKDADWAATQTIAPANIVATPLSSTTINLAWDAIPFTGYAGGYRISVGSASGGPYTFYLQTANKSTHSQSVSGLTSATPYYFVIQTRSDANASNNNEVDSEFSSEATATTLVAETVSTPTTPSGPSSGLITTSYDFSSGGSVSSFGHSLQYKFDWDDGNDSGWLAEGTTQASHSWSAAGIYNVRAMARCASDTAIESIWSDIHAITITDGSSTGHYNSPAQRLILPEVNWASASGGGDWVSEVQITDVTGGSVVQVYYNSGTNRRGPFTLWSNNGGAAGSSTSWSNMLQTIDGLDAGVFTYYGTGGSLEMITQDNSHKIQAAIRSYNGNYSRTFPALADVETNTAASGRTLIVPNMSMDSNFRPSLVLFNPSASSVTADVEIIGSNGSLVGLMIAKTVAGYEMTGVAGLRNDTYSNADIRVTVTGGSGRLIVSGQSANNTSNDPAAHLAVQTGMGYANSPANRLIFPEVNWALANGGGDWVSELHITDLSGGAVVQVYYNSGTNRRGPFTLWTNSGDPNCSVTFSNILQTIDGLDGGAFTYYGTGGALELVTQDGSHLIQAALKGYNGNATRTFPAFQDVPANTAALGRDVMIPNLSNDTQYRPSVALFSTTADSVTVEARIIGSNGAQIGSTLTKTLAGYEMGGMAGLRNYTYSNATVRITVTGGSGRVLASGQSANNTSNDPAAHIAVQGQ